MDNSSTRPLAVVTGASSGIGLELAKQFAQNGFDLLIASQARECRENDIAGAQKLLSSY